KNFQLLNFITKNYVMAIVFISPQQKQRKLLWIILGILVLVLAIVSVITFLPELSNHFPTVSAEQAFVAPDVAINFATIDSSQVKDLQPFLTIQTEFSYI